jgi:hypothetical protein
LGGVGEWIKASSPRNKIAPSEACCARIVVPWIVSKYTALPVFGLALIVTPA